MSLDGCHLCRPQNPEPETAMVVDIMTHGLVKDFHGVFDVVLHAAIEGENVTEDFLTNIHFDLQRELVCHLILKRSNGFEITSSSNMLKANTVT